MNSKHPLLGVNIDHVATLREARGTSYPSVLQAAEAAISGGADQITVHLREDRRHIKDKDVYNLKKVISVPLNLEMALEDEIVGIALDLRPATSTLVPERRQELTTEGGLDCVGNKGKLSKVIERLKGGGIGVSLFIDPEENEVLIAKELGADTIELHTGAYCEKHGLAERDKELKKIRKAAGLAERLGLKVAAGHGLNYENTPAVVSAVPQIVEYNIGHAIVARAVFVGLREAVAGMKGVLYDPRNRD